MTRPQAHSPLLAIAVAILVFTGAVFAGSGEPQQPDENDRCPVCGMLVAPHADWLAQVVVEGEETRFFDGAKCFFRYLLDPERSSPAAAEGAAVFVTSYYHRQPLDARKAYFVIGSDVLGPMGAELIPHETPEAAEEFMSDHGGSAIVRFSEVTHEVLASLGGGHH